MALRMYEMRFLRRSPNDREPVEVVAERMRYAFDLTEVEVTRDLLNRFLLGASDREGLPREQAHLIYLELRGLDRFGEPDEDVEFWRWSLPAMPDPGARGTGW